jgi:hypothetical protein
MATVKRRIQDLLGRFGIRVSIIKKRGNENFGNYIDDEFPETYKRFCDASMVPWQGMHDAFDAAKYVTESSVD